MENRPWYLQDKFLYTICLILPLIGYIIVLSNKKEFTHEEWLPFLLVATIMTAFWLLKFLPTNMFFIGIIITIIIIYIVIKN
ncbi:hypothetical protein KOY_04466 [Bacillus cereus VDM021]|nr:hypothetical protein IIW_04957 [Bacillus cereus VD136]EOP70042.1 hypothetical protein KOW_04889 [Bacillus cereus VDM006]EOQ05461.1 hypothetical protein KOY_04466 [Bacillus cereus VDM021]PEI82225.1 hypothetical protein CN679_28125 [Bacillus pseudomycoides]EOP72166.1 hypothetical protein KOW_05369 [Bacillus cereus VDM006]